MTLFVTRVNQTRTESYPLFLDLNNCLEIKNGGRKRKEGGEKTVLHFLSLETFNNLLKKREIEGNRTKLFYQFSNSSQVLNHLTIRNLLELTPV